MKKLLISILLLSIGLSGCTYYKATYVRMIGDNIKFPVSMIPAGGDRAELLIRREVYFSLGKDYSKPVTEVFLHEKDNN